MAAAPAIAASLLPKPTARIPTVRSSSVAVPTPPHPKLARRRNYLRRKLITTLPKPSPETLTSTQTPLDERQEFELEAPQVPKTRDSESPAAPDAVEESESPSSNAKGSDFVEGSAVVEPSPPPGLGIISARTAVRFGACFVGIFLLQAVVRALVVDSADSKNDKRTRRRSNRDERFEINGNGNPYGEKLEIKNGALLYVDEAELEAKIAEIRLMALEAKECERKNSGNADLSSDDEEEESDDDAEDDSRKAKTGIEREIDGMLTRVRKGLDSVRENSQVMNVNFLSKSKQEDAEKGKNSLLDEREKDEDMLMFEKKYKFLNGDSNKMREKPKGFQGSGPIGKKRNVGGKGNRGDIELERETINGNVQDSSVEQIADRATQHSVPVSNGRSKGSIKKVEATSQLWWLNLPYVLAIAMQQGYEEVEERGFYSLKSKWDDESSGAEASHTVLFEDRGDAHNFSLLLESYFEELEDIRITVVPLPIKELNDAVRSQTKKVIVVRKGQLRLYAGQPLDEVETALRSLLT